MSEQTVRNDSAKNVIIGILVSLMLGFGFGVDYGKGETERLTNIARTIVQPASAENTTTTGAPSPK